MLRFKQILCALAAAALGGGLATAQQWEVGAGGGASLYNTKTIGSPSGSVEAKFKPGYGFTAIFGQIGNRVGGEVRYSWQSNEMELSGLGKTFTMGGRSQTLAYNVLVYFAGREAKVRPYVLGGGGIKQYTGTGSASALQPLLQIAVLTNTSEWKPVVNAGGGIRFATGKKAHVRAELLVTMSEAPTKVVTPVSGSLSGWYFQFMPVFSLSYVW